MDKDELKTASIADLFFFTLHRVGIYKDFACPDERYLYKIRLIVPKFKVVEYCHRVKGKMVNDR